MNKKLGYQILELCGILLGNAILAFGIAAFVLPHGMITGCLLYTSPSPRD